MKKFSQSQVSAVLRLFLRRAAPKLSSLMDQSCKIVEKSQAEIRKKLEAEYNKIARKEISNFFSIRNGYPTLKFSDELGKLKDRLGNDLEKRLGEEVTPKVGYTIPHLNTRDRVVFVEHYFVQNAEIESQVRKILKAYTDLELKLTVESVNVDLEKIFKDLGI